MLVTIILHTLRHCVKTHLALVFFVWCITFTFAHNLMMIREAKTGQTLLQTKLWDIAFFSFSKMVYPFATIHIFSLKNPFIMPSFKSKAWCCYCLGTLFSVGLFAHNSFQFQSIQRRRPWNIIFPKHHRLSGLIVGMVQAFGLRGV